MYFEFSTWIERPPSDVFAFLRDKDLYPQEPGSPVLILERTTAGSVGVGTQYREVVRMLPFVKGTILSEITRFEPPTLLEEDFRGPGMRGHLAYEFEPDGVGCRLTQRETLDCVGLLRALSPLVQRSLQPRLVQRIEGIKAVLESGWLVKP